MDDRYVRLSDYSMSQIGDPIERYTEYEGKDDSVNYTSNIPSMGNDRHSHGVHVRCPDKTSLSPDPFGDYHANYFSCDNSMIDILQFIKTL